MKSERDARTMAADALARGPGGTSSSTAASGWARSPWRRFCAARARGPRWSRTLTATGQPRSPDASRALSRSGSPLAAGRPTFLPAQSVIYLFMAGGPSQLELFDYKPELQKYSGQPIPDSFIHGRRFAFMDIFTKEHPRLLGTVRKFARHGQSGAWVSALLAAACRGCRRPDVRQIGGDGRLQSCAGEALCQYRDGAIRPAEHGRLDHLRHRQRIGQPAGIRRAPVRPTRAARGGGQLEQRLPAIGLPGRSATGGGEPILNLNTPERDLARPPAPDDRGHRGARIRPPGRDRRPRDRDAGSTPTRPHSGCRSSAPS